jgi:hypothetical protein
MDASGIKLGGAPPRLIKRQRLLATGDLLRHTAEIRARQTLDLGNELLNGHAGTLARCAHPGRPALRRLPVIALR